MPLDLDAARAGACHLHCATRYAYNRHSPLCRADDILELVDEIERLRAAVALHREARISLLPEVPAGWCAECEQLWPCPTVTTAEGGGDA